MVTVTRKKQILAQHRQAALGKADRELQTDEATSEAEQNKIKNSDRSATRDNPRRKGKIGGQCHIPRQPVPQIRARRLRNA